MRMHLQAVLAGEAALHHLQAAHFTVLAAFSRSLYLANPSGKLVCLCRDDLEPSPLALLCAPWFAPDALPQPGERMTLTDGILQNQHFTLSFAGCPLWVPSPFPLPDARHIAASLRLLQEHVTQHPPQQGFAPLLHPLATVGACTVEMPLPAVYGSPLLQEGWKGLAALCRWLRPVEKNAGQSTAGDSETLDLAVRLLTGLGPGLTPSGDDALGGAMIALHALGRHEHALHLGSAVRAHAAQATNSISRAHLELAASGQGAAPLHRTLEAFMRADPGLGLVAQGLDHMGHSSGWDAFCGVVAVFSATLSCGSFEKECL